MSIKIYKLRADANRFQNLTTDDDGDWCVLGNMRGQSVSRRWRPIPVHVVREGKRNRMLPDGDFPSLGVQFPTFSSNAMGAVAALLRASGEWLPLQSRDGEFWLFNVTDTRNALDIERSECTFFTDGTLMDVGRCRFVESELTGAVIFRISQAPMMDIFVTDALVNCVKESGLRGFEFVPSWE